MTNDYARKQVTYKQKTLIFLWHVPLSKKKTDSGYRSSVSKRYLYYRNYVLKFSFISTLT